jgi:GxxExxY protein
MDGRRQKANAWSRIFIGAAIEVHRLKGPGLLEPIYRKCVRRECELRDIPTQYELIVPIEYKETTFEEPLRLDVLIDDCLIVELKAVEKILPIHKAQLLSYMELLKQPLGLLINFHEVVLKRYPPACSLRWTRRPRTQALRASLASWLALPS